jgi:hypothetical protein
MKDIYSTNPYANFAPAQYNLKGSDLVRWGIDKTHKEIMTVAQPKKEGCLGKGRKGK